MRKFVYDFPVKNYFGKGVLTEAMEIELPCMGSVVMLAYGGGSVKKIGVYDEVVSLLEKAGKTIVEFSGIMPNPTYEKVQEGAVLARECGVDFILAVGGGSVFDCCKIVSAQAKCETDIYELEFARHENPTDFIPMGCVVTLSGTGAEQNAGGVITDEARMTKGGFFGALPRFAVLDPSYTLSVPYGQFMSGAFDTLSHCMETYFGEPRVANVSDDINESIQRSVIRSMRALITDPDDYEAHSELMYASALAENGLLKIGKTTDFQCHMIQHQLGAYTHSNHGFGLAVIHPSVYRLLAPNAPEQFARWAMNVWGVDPAGADRSDLDVAFDGIAALELFIGECGLPMKFSDMGLSLDDEVLRVIAETSIVTPGCVRKLERDEIFGILKRCV